MKIIKEVDGPDFYSKCYGGDGLWDNLVRGIVNLTCSVCNGDIGSVYEVIVIQCDEDEICKSCKRDKKIKELGI